MVKQFTEELRELLDRYGKTQHQDGAYCTIFFVTAEFIDANGEYFAKTFFNEDGTPVWRITGLVQHALENDFTIEED